MLICVHFPVNYRDPLPALNNGCSTPGTSAPLGSQWSLTVFSGWDDSAEVKRHHLTAPAEPPDPFRRKQTQTLWTSGCCQVIVITQWHISTCTAVYCHHAEYLGQHTPSAWLLHMCAASWLCSFDSFRKAARQLLVDGVSAVAISTINETQTFLCSEF